MTVETTPYTHEMVIVHRVFRREAAVLQRLVPAVRPGGVARAAQIGAAFREYAGGLHHHHHLEDELIWPKLHERAGDQDELVSTMEKQHARLDETLTAVHQLLPVWEAEAASGDDLAAALNEHRTVLVEHLDDEESLVLPLVAAHLTVPEWDEVGRRGLETIPKSKVMLALGAILEDADEDERRYFLGKVPLPGRVLWRLAGQHQYRRRMAELRGTAA